MNAVKKEDSRLDPPRGPLSLWAYSPASDSTSASIVYLRELSQVESEQVAVALTLFTDLTIGAPFVELQRTHEELVDALSRYRSSQDQYVAEELSREVRRRFRHWLGDVVTFKDRLRPMFSRHFGRDHYAVSLVLELHSNELRKNFAYELVVEALRNESTHAQEILNVLRQEAFNNHSGEPKRLNLAKIDTSLLAQTISRRESKSKAAFTKASGIIDVGLLAARTMDSCFVIHANLIRALKIELEPLVTTIRELHSEVTAAGAGWSLIGNAKELNEPGRWGFRSVQNPWQQAETLISQFEEWTDEYMGSLHVRVTAEQLIESSAEVGYIENISVGFYDQVPPDFLEQFFKEARDAASKL